ncbi:T9SS type A sorting domain-containing protein [Hymenobacter cellulosivorans]|uniref:T9SS type A sorting domain-containing protein n=1 Tax=Hymenobacter cellulosivorans TaxID=2932249 RepID=A0ABY4F8B5_9BACT|nr:T9SS type A sorting domain-containing protein [Hymenobacter cellulosivorans]UOQ52899.1 T9SS type A sorting domain-containing protein [Hymenobacter cellulosivorans]
MFPLFSSSRIALAILGLAALPAQAQVAPTWNALLRAYPLNSSSIGQTQRVAVAPDGNPLASGTFVGHLTIGGVTLSTPGGSQGVQMFLVRLNPDGTLAWSQQGSSSSSQDDQRTHVSVDAAGNSFFSGNFRGRLGFGTTALTSAPAALSEVFVRKYDAQGNLLWSRTGGLTTGGVLGNIATAVDASGNVLVTGTYSGTDLSFGSTTKISSPDQAVFLAKFNSAGTLQWLRQDGGNNRGGAYVWDLGTDAAGNTVMVGDFFSHSTFGSVTLTPLEGASFMAQDIFVVKYSPQGTVLWAKQAGGLFVDAGRGIAVTGDGQIAISGATDNESAYLARFDGQGNRLWERKMVPVATGTGVGQAVAFNSRGHLFVTGTFKKGLVVGPTTLSTGRNSTNLFLAQFDAAGNVLWADQVGGPAEDAASNSSDVATDAAGNIFVTGAVGGTVSFGGITSVRQGTFNGSPMVPYVARLTAGVPLSTARFVGAALALYPNPASAYTQLVLPAGAQVTITDALGRQVREQTFAATTQPQLLSVAGLTPGLYQVRATLTTGEVAQAALTVR